MRDVIVLDSSDDEDDVSEDATMDGTLRRG